MGSAGPVEGERRGLQPPGPPVLHAHPPPLPIPQLERAGRVDHGDAAVHDECDPVAQLGGDSHVVGGEEDRPTLVPQPGDDLLDPAGVDRVQPGGRLVEEQQLRLMKQGLEGE